MFEEHANKLLVIDIAITINVSLLLVCRVNWRGKRPLRNQTSCTNSSVSSMESTSPIVCITSASSGTYACVELFCMENNQRSSILTCSLYKAISLFIKNLECLPDLIFNLWILELPEKYFLPTERGQDPYLVISQTNSLKLMSPSPSWSMTETISWIIFGTNK